MPWLLPPNPWKKQLGWTTWPWKAAGSGVDGVNSSITRFEEGARNGRKQSSIPLPSAPPSRMQPLAKSSNALERGTWSTTRRLPRGPIGVGSTSLLFLLLFSIDENNVSGGGGRRSSIGSIHEMMLSPSVDFSGLATCGKSLSRNMSDDIDEEKQGTTSWWWLFIFVFFFYFNFCETEWTTSLNVKLDWKSKPKNMRDVETVVREK